MNYDEEEDKMLFDMVCESNEEVRDSLYEKYKSLIDLEVKKFVPTALKVGIDLNDLQQEANVGFTDAINSFNASKEASLKTFIQLCIERKLINYVKKHQSVKYKISQDTLSLDYEYDTDGASLKESIGDDTLDPLRKYSEKENHIHFYNKVKSILSESEMEVFLYMVNHLNYTEIAKILDKSPKQIDNTMQRIRFKLKEIFKEEDL